MTVRSGFQHLLDTQSPAVLKKLKLLTHLLMNSAAYELC